MFVSEEEWLWFVSSCDLAFQDEVRNWVMLMFMVLEGWYVRNSMVFILDYSSFMWVTEMLS